MQKKIRNLSQEKLRIYEWIDPISGKQITHRIHDPISLCVSETTHRVADSIGLVHCVPSVGYFGCVVYWEYKDKNPQALDALLRD